MKLSFYSFIFLFFYVSLHSQITLQAKLKKYKIPKKALKLLNSLPDKSLTLDLILKKGLTSDNFEIIKLQNLEKRVLKYAAKIPFDTYISASVLKGNDKSASTRPGSPYNNQLTNGNLKLSSNFLTGTSVSLESAYKNNNSLSPSFTGSGSEIHTKYHENKISLNLRQDLLKNSFGYYERKTLQALNIQKQNVKNKFSVNVENWSYKLIETFYTAWLLKAKVQVAQSNYYRQRRLKNITYLKFKRGTAKKSDLLQTQSAEKNSKQNLNSSKQDLENIWRNLVVQLNFPKDWLNINPFLIPIKLDNPIFKALKSCKKDLDIKSNWEVKSLTKQYKASQLNLSAAKNQMLPEVYFGLKLSSNAVNPDNPSQALQDSLQNKNKGVFVELGLSIPIGRYKEKSKLAKSVMNKKILQYRLSSLKKTIQTKWKNECLNLLRLKKKKKELQLVKSMQKQRAKLEEKRFRIGKVPVFNNIQAGLDSALSKLAFKQSEVSLRLSAWRILKMNSKLINYINKLSSNK
ncbi:MAG: TolC family protein [Bdellovibrionales bacterium]|nr:TolC family protein [Bdellovibrionales bacterium]